MGEMMFLSSFSDTFEKTFIKEDRWKLLLDGVGVTLKISVFAAILGLLIGFLIGSAFEGSCKAGLFTGSCDRIGKIIDPVTVACKDHPVRINAVSA